MDGGNRHHAGNHHHLRPGCGRARALHASRHGGDDYPRKHGVRLAGENDFLYGRPGPGHYLRLQPGRLDGHANRPFRGYIHHAQRAGRNGDGRIRHGAAARHLRHRPGQRRCEDLHESRLRETQTELQRSIVNGAGKPCARASPTPSAESFTRGTPTTPGAAHQNADGRRQCGARRWPRPCGNTTPSATEQKETWKLADPATVSNSRITAWSYGTEQSEDGVYQVVRATRNNGRGTTCDETQKTLLSSLVHAGKQSHFHRPQGKRFRTMGKYGPGAVRTQKSSIPTSNVIATATVIDGFTASQTDHAGVTATIPAPTRKPASSTPARTAGATRSRRTDLAGRTISVTDAAGQHDFYRLRPLV